MWGGGFDPTHQKKGDGHECLMWSGPEAQPTLCTWDDESPGRWAI
jgi:hypothetical protein